MMFNFILLQAEGTEQQGNQWSFWIMMIIIFVIFYFIKIHPKSKKNKEIQKYGENVMKDDKDASMNNTEQVAKHNRNAEHSSVVTSTPPNFSFCTTCGAKIPKGAKFCTSCGTEQKV